MPVNQNKIDMAKYRLGTAAECLHVAQLLLAEDTCRSSANRSYYAIFHGMRAVLALDGLDFSKHSAVISKFRELYIKTNIFDPHFSKIIRIAFDIRQDSDYEDFFVISKEDTREQVDGAAEFLAAVHLYLEKRITEQ